MHQSTRDLSARELAALTWLPNLERPAWLLLVNTRASVSGRDCCAAATRVVAADAVELEAAAESWLDRALSILRLFLSSAVSSSSMDSGSPCTSHLRPVGVEGTSGAFICTANVLLFICNQNT